MGKMLEKDKRDSLEKLKNQYEQAKLSGDTKRAKMYWDMLKKLLGTK